MQDIYLFHCFKCSFIIFSSIPQIRYLLLPSTGQLLEIKQKSVNYFISLSSRCTFSHILISLKLEFVLQSHNLVDRGILSKWHTTLWCISQLTASYNCYLYMYMSVYLNNDFIFIYYKSWDYSFNKLIFMPLEKKSLQYRMLYVLGSCKLRVKKIFFNYR